VPGRLGVQAEPGPMSVQQPHSYPTVALVANREARRASEETAHAPLTPPLPRANPTHQRPGEPARQHHGCRMITASSLARRASLSAAEPHGHRWVLLFSCRKRLVRVFFAGVIRGAGL